MSIYTDAGIGRGDKKHTNAGISIQYFNSNLGVYCKVINFDINYLHLGKNKVKDTVTEMVGQTEGGDFHASRIIHCGA